MASSDYDNVLLLMQTQINDLNLQFDSVAVPVVIRKLPIVQEIDSAPMICISQSGPEEYKKYFAGHYFAMWRTQVNIISANNGDGSTNIDLYSYWRQQIIAMLESNAVTYANLLRIDVGAETAISPFEIPANYDYLPLNITFTLFY